ncbi:MAG: SGNH/GDSL hydrolase family protein [Saprospiraceae bacterium]|nr:SGNH/GDSL hydrolase family protein [Saprospiraceae bacterium]
MNWESMICFGDSITIGARSYLGYPEYAGNILSKRLGNHWNIINAAVSGFTTIDLARYISHRAYEFSSSNPDFFVVFIGTNDLKSKTSADDFAIAYEQVILKAKLICKARKGFLVKIPLLQTGVCLPYTFDMNTTIAEYNNIIAQLGETYNIPLITFAFQPEDCFDGVHLNDHGARKTGQQLADQLLSIKGLF